MEDDGYTGEDDEPTDEEWSELDAGETGAAGLEPLDGNDNDGLFAATLRASGETANSHESSCESMNTDMHEPSPDRSSDEAQLMVAPFPLLVHLLGGCMVEEVAIRGVAEVQQLEMQVGVVLADPGAVEELAEHEAVEELAEHEAVEEQTGYEVVEQ